MNHRSVREQRPKQRERERAIEIERECMKGMLKRERPAELLVKREV